MSFLAGAYSGGRVGKSIRYLPSGKMPSAKITKYNPGKDIVAGRTASQIERAKRMAVGGKKKRCVKGKSCSATCIAANKVCMVEIPWAAAKGIPKVVATIKQIQEKKPSSTPKEEEMKKLAQDFYKVEWTKAWKKMNLAINDGDKQKYKFWKDSISDYHAKLTAKGVDVGPLKIPVWKDKTPSVTLPEPRTTNKPTKPTTEGTSKNVDSKGRPLSYKPLKELPGFVSATGTVPPMPSLKNESRFYEVIGNTNYSKDPKHPYWKADSFHERLRGVLTVGSTLTPEQRDIADKMGGERKFRESVPNVRKFTEAGIAYKNMRAAQRANAEGKTLSDKERKYLEMADSAEKLISLLPKEPMVKFRGAPASKEKLAATIAASKEKGEHSEGALSSWSTRLEIAQNFADSASQDQERIIYVTANKRGASVRSASQIPEEEEILTPGSTRFRHTGRYDVVKVGGDIYHVFYMDEL